MRTKVAELSENRREDLLAGIQQLLDARPDILFAYVHGSFITQERCNDIDIAVFLDPLPESPLQTELLLEAELGNAVGGFPVDVRVLNSSPLSFRYNVVRYGRPLLVRDDDRRSDFVEATLSQYFDFSPFRRMYLKETLGLPPPAHPPADS